MTKIDINKENNQVFMVRFISRTEIELNKVINELDRFVLDFLEILKKYSDYVIVSGYVAILLGRTRTTEDIDILIPKLSKEKLNEFFKEIISKGYWFINSDEFEDIYDILQDNDSVRISKKPQINPNIEIKFIKSKLDNESFRNSITVNLNNHKIRISNLELQVAYKKTALKADKDHLDADHLLELFKDNLNNNLIAKYKLEIENEYR